MHSEKDNYFVLDFAKDSFGFSLSDNSTYINCSNLSGNDLDFKEGDVGVLYVDIGLGKLWLT